MFWRKITFTQVLIWILVVLVVVLSLVAGYYQQAWSLQVKKYNRLEDMYVRLRGQLGVERTQELIDQSYLD